jgi:hypothetical protein
MLGAILAGVLMAWAPAHSAEAPDVVAKATLRQALGAISQGDGTTAKKLIGSINLAALPDDQKSLATCISGRLDGPVERKSGAILETVSQLYRQYWLDAAMGRVPVDQAEHNLRRKLVQAFRLPEGTDWDGVEAALETAVKKQGSGVLMGRTGRLRELMIWTSERTEKRDVTLPEGAFNVSVTYLDKFASLGWSKYLSCDRIGTGGWAKPDGLYAVVPAYPSLDDELFRLSFLTHETQHFSDYSRFPGLKPWELEYRAKLVELTYAEKISPMLLRGFGSAVGRDPADSHAYANGRVLADIRTRLVLGQDADLTTLPLADIQRAALEALMADSGKRQSGTP